MSLDGEARALIGTWRNSGRLDPAGYRDHFAKRSYEGFSIRTRRLSENSFVLTGEGDGKKYYEKAVFSCQGRLISSVAMIYPLEHRQVYEPLIEGMERSFQPGSVEDCKPPPQSQAQLMRRAPKVRGEKTARSGKIDVPLPAAAAVMVGKWRTDTAGRTWGDDRPPPP